MESELLVVRAQLGDREAFAELVRVWERPVAEYVRHMLVGAGPAEDVGQEVWLAVLKGLPRLRQPERFAAWLFTVARRQVMNQLRGKYADGSAGGAPTELAGEDPVDVLIDRLVITRWLSALPLVEREVLVMFHLHDLSLDECAEILRIPVGTVKSRLHRARRMVREEAARE
ncbi:sigma-70 family RNA polymerase sigma factor [Kribbella sp. NBC_01245]|uniref:RNA polymerase sigma factor n=1 Tax=Kribbella sp. NBC_01245 TaxID=2903578 RepID=UPI002E2C416C|nr:sigma-70 family RNA polymerase sigma factor [Kribbella sp. NBC_01245]